MKNRGMVVGHQLNRGWTMINLSIIGKQTDEGKLETNIFVCQSDKATTLELGLLIVLQSYLKKTMNIVADNTISNPVEIKQNTLSETKYIETSAENLSEIVKGLWS